ncbi:hypothetical protein J6590_010902 [Homalodisca vitripennis]|nr:hypothetical protein J6590_010902 [Homalodisca vitripennis]
MDDTVSRSTTRHVALRICAILGEALDTDTSPSPPSIIHFTLLLTNYNRSWRMFLSKVHNEARGLELRGCEPSAGICAILGEALDTDTRPPPPSIIHFTLLLRNYNLHGECFSVKYSRMDDTVSRSTTRHVALSCEGVSQVPGSVLFWERPLTPTPGHLPSINYTLYSFVKTYYNLHGECFSVKYSRMDDTVSRSTTRHVALSCEGVSQVQGSVLFWERPLTPTPGHLPSINYTLYSFVKYGECFSVKYSRMDDTVSRSTTRHVALSCEGVSQVPGSVLFWERPLTPTPGHLPSINYTLYSFVNILQSSWRMFLSKVFSHG